MVVLDPTAQLQQGNVVVQPWEGVEGVLVDPLHLNNLLEWRPVPHRVGLHLPGESAASSLVAVSCRHRPPIADNGGCAEITTGRLKQGIVRPKVPVAEVSLCSFWRSWGLDVTRGAFDDTQWFEMAAVKGFLREISVALPRNLNMIFVNEGMILRQNDNHLHHLLLLHVVCRKKTTDTTTLPENIYIGKYPKENILKM